MICIQCSKDTNNPKFCGRSCAASYNNRAVPKRKWIPNTHCTRCGVLVERQERRLCDACSSLRLSSEGGFVDFRTATKKDFLTKDTQKYRRIREHARSVALENHKLDACMVCGYSTHVECCHVRDIRDYPLDALISEINSPDNLVGLCPNHHWEFDKGLLFLPKGCPRRDLNPQPSA